MNKQLELILKYPFSDIIEDGKRCQSLAYRLELSQDDIPIEWPQLGKCKLELTPLEDITEEDLIEVARLSNVESQLEFIGNAYKNGMVVFSNITKDVSDFLRSNSYNIDDPSWEYSVRKNQLSSNILQLKKLYKSLKISKLMYEKGRI